MINILEQFCMDRHNINHSHISLQELQHCSALSRFYSSEQTTELIILILFNLKRCE